MLPVVYDGSARTSLDLVHTPLVGGETPQLPTSTHREVDFCSSGM
jgi:hypothetical protein